MDNAKAPKLAGVIGFFDDPDALIQATEKVRDARFPSFDVFTPYPIHGLEQAQGLSRSWIPFITFIAGLTGVTCAFALQYWTSAVDWPLIVGGKPFNSWPAFVPIMFELTVLFAGLATAGGMILINGLPNIKQKAFDPALTRDRFAIVIDAPKGAKHTDYHGHPDPDEPAKPLPAGIRPFSEVDAQALLKQIGAKEVRSVYQEGWFS